MFYIEWTVSENSLIITREIYCKKPAKKNYRCIICQKKRIANAQKLDIILFKYYIVQ
jgi:hypothetical protein